jgi:KaiC/GvpD/RAD55 family RecA-like ATPase
MERVKTGIPGLDEMLHGGLLPQTATLVEGGARNGGRTTLGMQFIYHGIVEYDEPGIILTFEQFPQPVLPGCGQLRLGFPAAGGRGKVAHHYDQSRRSPCRTSRPWGGQIEALAHEMGRPPHPGG